MSVNRVILTGHLTRDPETRYTPQGTPVASFGLAVNRYTKNETGDYDVDFFNITTWNKTAEFAQNYLKKGRLVAVDGRLQTRSWTDQASGQKRTAFEIVAERLEPLGPRSEGSGHEGDHDGGYDSAAPAAPAAYAQPAAAPAPRTAAPPAARPAARPAPVEDDNESDPFADE